MDCVVHAAALYILCDLYTRIKNDVTVPSSGCRGNGVGSTCMHTEGIIIASSNTEYVTQEEHQLEAYNSIGQWFVSI